MPKFDNQELTGIGLNDDATVEEKINYYSPFKSLEFDNVNFDIDVKSGDFSSKRSDWLEVDNPNHDENINKYTITIPSMPLISSGTTIKSFNTALSSTLQTPSRAEIIRRNIEAMTPATRADRLHRLEHQINRNPYEEIEYKVLGRMDINEKSAESDYNQKLHDEKISNQPNFVFNIESNFELWRNPSLHSFLQQDDWRGSSPLRSNQKISVWVGNKVIMDGVYVDENGNQHTGRGNLDDYQIRDKNNYWSPGKWDDVMLRSQINSSDGVYLTKDLKKLKDFEMNKTENHPVAIGKVDRYFDTIGMDIGHRILTEQKFRNADGNLKSTSDVNKLLDEEYYKGEFGARGLPTLEGMRSAVQETKKNPLLTTPNFSTENPVQKIKWTSDNIKPSNTNTRTNMVFLKVGALAGVGTSVSIGKDDYNNYYVARGFEAGISAIPIKYGGSASILTGTTMEKHNSASEAQVKIAGNPYKPLVEVVDGKYTIKPPSEFGYSKSAGFTIGSGWTFESGFEKITTTDSSSLIAWRSVEFDVAISGGVSRIMCTGNGNDGLRNAIELAKRSTLGIVQLSPEWVEETLRNFEPYKDDNVETLMK